MGKVVNVVKGSRLATIARLSKVRANPNPNQIQCMISVFIMPYNVLYMFIMHYRDRLHRQCRQNYFDFDFSK